MPGNRKYLGSALLFAGSLGLRVWLGRRFESSDARQRNRWGFSVAAASPEFDWRLWLGWLVCFAHRWLISGWRTACVARSVAIRNLFRSRCHDTREVNRSDQGKHDHEIASNWPGRLGRAMPQTACRTVLLSSSNWPSWYNRCASAIRRKSLRLPRTFSFPHRTGSPNSFHSLTSPEHLTPTPTPQPFRSSNVTPNVLQRTFAQERENGCGTASATRGQRIRCAALRNSNVHYCDARGARASCRLEPLGRLWDRSLGRPRNSGPILGSKCL